MEYICITISIITLLVLAFFAGAAWTSNRFKKKAEEYFEEFIRFIGK